MVYSSDGVPYKNNQNYKPTTLAYLSDGVPFRGNFIYSPTKFLKHYYHDKEIYSRMFKDDYEQDGQKILQGTVICQYPTRKPNEVIKWGHRQILYDSRTFVGACIDSGAEKYFIGWELAKAYGTATGRDI